MESDEEIQKQLDSQIHRLELELGELKRRRNALSPISQLPPEIFSKIFVLSIPDLDYKDHEGRSRSQAMNISHVSHTWRNIAIGCSDRYLWGNLQVGLATKGELVTLALGRSRNAPVSINVCGFKRTGNPTVPSEATLSALSKGIREGQGRCRHLALYMRQDTFQSLFKGVSGGFDDLVSLKLDILGIDHRYADLSEFFQLPFPRLRRFEVVRPRIPCTVLRRWPQLTHMDIEELVGSSTIITDLISCLKHWATGLRVLRVGTITMPFPLPTLEEPSAKGNNSIHLPYLEFLGLRCHSALQITVLEYFLSYISVPHMSCLRVSSGEGERLAALVGSAYGHLAPVVLYTGFRTESIRAYRDILSEPWYPEQDEGRTPWISIDQFGGIGYLIKIWEWGWSLASLRVLNVGDLHKVDQSSTKRFWLFLADSAVTLETIRINSYWIGRTAIYDFLKCLRGSRGVGGTQQIPWPALQEIHSTLPCDPGDEYRRVREDVDAPPLHPQLEYALDVADALKSRELAAPGSIAKRLAVLAFTSVFKAPLDTENRRTLRAAAEKFNGWGEAQS